MSGRKRWTHLDQMVGKLLVDALGDRDIFGRTSEQAAADDHRVLYGDGTKGISRGILPSLTREVPSYLQGPETRQQRRARERRERESRPSVNPTGDGRIELSQRTPQK